MTKEQTDRLRDELTEIGDKGFATEVDLSPVITWLSSGCTLLDLALSGGKANGGFPAGRISHIYGAESTAKTVLAAEPLGSAQRQGGKGYLVDAEWTFDLERARSVYGVNVTDPAIWELSRPSCVEELFDDVIDGALTEIEKEGIPIAAMSIDSLSSLRSKTEAIDSKGKPVKIGEMGGYGASRARRLSTAFRIKIQDIAASNLALIFVDQARDDLSSPYKAETTASGRAIKFYSSVRLYLKYKGMLKNKHKQPIGVNLGFKVEKNKVAPPFRSGEFELYFDYGIDDVGTSLKWIKSVTAPSSRKWEFDGQSYYFDDMVKYVEDNDKEALLKERMVAVWAEVFPPSSRKPRSRL